MIVASGTVDMRIAVNPLSMRVSPQLIRLKGMALPITPMTNEQPSHSRRPRGHVRPRTATMITSTSAPMPIRAAATVIGGIVSTASLISRNDDPHTAPSARSSP